MKESTNSARIEIEIPNQLVVNTGGQCTSSAVNADPVIHLKCLLVQGTPNKLVITANITEDSIGSNKNIIVDTTNLIKNPDVTYPLDPFKI